MASKKPLAYYAGDIKQLQAGDTLDAPVASPDIYSMTNGEAAPIVIGTAVYVSAAATIKKAKADAAGTSRCVGLVYDASISNGVAGNIIIGGILTATTGQWDAVAGTTGGLTADTVYYLSKDTSGNITSTAPTAVGQFGVRIGVALSTTDLLLQLMPPITL